ncbi:MAG: methyl-accepting chemotaxis protein, partial [Exilispira sp.]
KVLITTIISIFLTNFMYCLVLPQTTLMEKAEAISFYKRTFLLTFAIGPFALFAVYLLYRNIEKAIKKIERGESLLDYEFTKVIKSFTRIEILFLLIGGLSYILAIIANIAVEIISKTKLDLKFWSFRSILALSFGVLNGIVLGRLINFAWIDAKSALKIKILKENIKESKTINKLVIPVVLLLFVNISFFSIAAINFFDRYAFTFIKFNFIFKHFVVLAIKFIFVDSIILVSMLLEHQKHLDHLNSQLNIMANQDMDLSSRVNIVSFDEIGRMISNVNIILNKLQDSFITVSNAEKIVFDYGEKIEDEFILLKDEYIKLSKIINEVQAIESNESKIVDKTSIDFKNLILAIENIVSKNKYQNEFIEQLSISLKSILSSFQTISKLMIDANQLFEGLVANIFGGEAEISRLSEINKKMNISNSEIKKITKLILDISDRSNLLAMNAAIEAAHAGESGVGFSVVAEEMRKLSEITSNSASQIESIINNIIQLDTEASTINNSIEIVFAEIHNQLKDTNTKMKDTAQRAQEEVKVIDKNIIEVEKLITLNEEIKIATEKIVEIQPVVISSLNELQKITKSLIESNNIMISSVEKMNNSVEFTSKSFSKMLDAVSQLKNILSTYKIGNLNETVKKEQKDNDLIEDKKGKINLLEKN